MQTMKIFKQKLISSLYFLFSDAERKEKVKRLYAEAALQQGELNALKRKK